MDFRYNHRYFPHIVAVLQTSGLCLLLWTRSSTPLNLNKIPPAALTIPVPPRFPSSSCPGRLDGQAPPDMDVERSVRQHRLLTGRIYSKPLSHLRKKDSGSVNIQERQIKTRRQKKKSQSLSELSSGECSSSSFSEVSILASSVDEGFPPEEIKKSRKFLRMFRKINLPGVR
ncbi:Hypothetical predicted protein [Pelobates cultripes]|uniref:Uncharacterized protein n=1 Tax=Pelobates cultripes TaxID=61616 RepID=A0AAD1WTU4_PELCU|nr:Hypothetical predicted protein [Pelobates cultripes]